MFNCKILADSLSPQGDRLTTMKVTFPRYILAEMNTHRMFSRNSASSRAIPFNKMVKMVQENPFIPIAWQKDHAGMQGTEYITHPDEIAECIEVWLSARDHAVKHAEDLHSDFNECSPVTKQLCNRLLEPFMWHTVIITSSEWENFFKLRCPQYQDHKGVSYCSWKDLIKSGSLLVAEEYKNYNLVDKLLVNKSQAEIHIQAIAELMWNAMNESIPKQLQAGEWHIPNLGHDWDEEWIKDYVSTIGGITQDYEEAIQWCKVKISTAHNARISYETLGDNPKIDYKADIKLHDTLLENGHASPLEHCAMAMDNNQYEHFVKGELQNTHNAGYRIVDGMTGWCRNFRGFIQYRHLIETKQIL